MAALHGLRCLTLTRAAEPVRVLLVGLGRPADCNAPPLRTATCWVSATPFVVTRHRKRRGQRKDPPELHGPGRSLDFAQRVLDEELARLRQRRPDVPLPASVAVWDGNRLSVRRLPPLAFQRSRRKPGDEGGRRAAGAFRIVFGSPVAGPLCLGHSSHFGLGLFLPEAPPPNPD